MENQTSTQDDIQKVYNYAASLLITQKKAPEDVINALMQQGLNKEEASRIVANLQQEVVKQRRAKAKRDMKYGLILCVIGIIITAVTHSMATGGGTYVVAYGAIAVGAIQFFRGLINSSR